MSDGASERGAPPTAQPVPVQPAADPAPVGPRVDAQQALAQLAVAVVVADEQGTILFCNAEAARLLRTEPETLSGRRLETIVPERFRSAHRRGFERYVETGVGVIVGGGPVRMFALRADGTEVDVAVMLRSLGPPQTTGFAVVGTLWDMSKTAEAARRPVLSSFLQAIVEAAPDGVLAVSPDRIVLAANQRFSEIWELPPGAVVVGGRSPALSDAQRGTIADPDAFEAAIRWGHEHPDRPQSLDVHLVDGRVVEGYSAPIIDEHGDYLGRVWYMHDATERRRAEQQRAELTQRLATAERSHRFLLQAADALARTSGFTDTLQALAEIAVPTLGDLCLIDVLDDTGRVVRMAAVHHDPRARAATEQLRQWPPDPTGDHPSVAVMRDRRSQMSPEMPQTFLAATTRSAEHLALLNQLGFRSYMSVPLIAEDQVLGAVTFISSGSDRVFAAADLSLAEDFAARTALVVAKERRYDRERQAAHTLQSNLLPTDLRPIDGIDVALRYLPGTGGAELGGDFWDATPAPQGEIALGIGDVSGHDMVAAAQMAQLRAVLRAIRPESSGPAELITRLQHLWSDLGLDRLATVALARLHTGTGRLRLASAGHPPPLLLMNGVAQFAPVVPGPPLGSEPIPPEECSVDLPSGGLAVFYTDGLVESRERDIDEGMDRLARAVVASRTTDPEALADHILGALTGQERGDDIALMVVRRSPG